jgi:putative Mn2+ efflux pump MntP
MGWLEIILLSLALSVDAFSVAAACALLAGRPAQILRMSLSFGGFQSGLAALGAVLGIFVYEYVAAYDHWVAFGLLEVIGLKMLVEAFSRKSRSGPGGSDPSRGWTVLGLGVAVSIDALGAGVGMAMSLHWTRLLVACGIIGVVAGLATWLGVRIGCAVQERLGGKTEALGGVVLILLGIRMLWI